MSDALVFADEPAPDRSVIAHDDEVIAGKPLASVQKGNRNGDLADVVQTTHLADALRGEGIEATRERYALRVASDRKAMFVRRFIVVAQGDEKPVTSETNRFAHLRTLRRVLPKTLLRIHQRL